MNRLTLQPPPTLYVPPEEFDRATPRALAAAQMRLEILRARKRCEAFIEYAFRHESDPNLRVRNAWFHNEWQQILRDHKYAVIIAPVEHAKSQSIAIAKPIHMLGSNPNLRGAIISNTAQQAEKILSAIRSHIEHNDRVHEVFPHLVPSTNPEHPWHQSMITVDRSTIAKDPSIQALGITGPLVGSRLDFVILDDVLDFEITRTAAQMEKLIEWCDTTLFTRLTEGACCWVVGTPWDPHDLLHVLSKRPAFFSKTYSAVENPDAPPEDWKPIWFGKQRLLDVRDNLTVHNFARKYLCQVRSNESSRFQKSWIDRCLLNGKGRSLMQYAPVAPSGKRYPCFTGVDLGVGQGEDHDVTVLFTISLDERWRRVVVDVQSGRWQAPEIIRRIYDVQLRFGSIVTVESNGAQRFLLEWAGAQGISVRAFSTTAKNKYDETFGVESLAVEMRSGQWVIPSGPSGEDPAPVIKEWIQEMLFYTPSQHTGDHLMACWFARETARDTMAPLMQQMDPMRR
jgi:hypothetical protein